jgi:hypothetical protein
LGRFRFKIGAETTKRLDKQETIRYSGAVLEGHGGSPGQVAEKNVEKTFHPGAYATNL